MNRIANSARNLYRIPFVYTRDCDIFGSHVKEDPAGQNISCFLFLHVLPLGEYLRVLIFESVLIKRTPL